MSNTGLVPGITGGYNAYTGASVMPTGMKLRFSHELLHKFSIFSKKADQKMRQNLFLYMFTIIFEI